MQKKKKVLVGMSGGVDSTVTACLLKEQGYDVIGIHLRFWVDPTVFSEDEIQKFPQNKCCTLEGLTRTRKIASRLGIPFYVLNFEDVFKEKVVDFFVEGYGNGITPNPCVECNRNVKFGFFLEKMKELGADFIATGHYARKKTLLKNNEESYELLTAKDHLKDQTYFLYTLTQEKLKHVLFPIGDYFKSEIRELAKKFDIDEVNQQKESQNLCFYPESKPGKFLKRYLEKTAFLPGPILTLQGEKIGEHNGLPNYTIGQRKGLGIGGIKGHENDAEQGWYVIRLDKKRNAVIVGRQSDLYSKTFRAHTLSFIDENFFRYLSENFAEGSANGYPVQAKIRSMFIRQPAEIFLSNNGKKVLVEFEKEQRAVTPGQSVVFYEGEKVLGGGIIE